MKRGPGFLPSQCVNLENKEILQYQESDEFLHKG